jgi:hypothetical protein
MQVKGSVRQHAYLMTPQRPLRLGAVRRSNGMALALPPQGLSSARRRNRSLASPAWQFAFCSLRCDGHDAASAATGCGSNSRWPSNRRNRARRTTNAPPLCKRGIETIRKFAAEPVPA